MKRLMSLVMAVILCVLPIAVQATTLLEYANKLKKVATNDGLTVMSPEQFLGIEPCDRIFGKDDYYSYVYTNRGHKWDDWGTEIPLDWFQMKEYVEALVKSEYYEILEHKNPSSDEEYWTLGYIGPGDITHLFTVSNSMQQKAAIVVRCSLGDIRVAFSKDILTADINETQQRLGKQVVDTHSSATSSTAPSGGPCTYCGGDGKCDKCGGDMWYWGYEWVYVNGSPVSQRVNKMCNATYCTGGKCSKCGGDGIQ